MADEEASHWRLLSLEKDRDDIFRRLRELELDMNSNTIAIQNAARDIREMKSASETAAREATATRITTEENREKAIAERSRERRGYFWSLGLCTLSVLLTIILTHFFPAPR